MTQVRALRAALEAFLGKERFVKFVRTGCSPRLRYWQEMEWEKFIFANPQFNIPFPELQLALRICPLHDQELLPDTVEIWHGNLDLNPRYLRERAEYFPYAAQDPISKKGAPGSEQRASVWCCPECRVVRGNYLEQGRIRQGQLHDLPAFVVIDRFLIENRGLVLTGRSLNDALQIATGAAITIKRPGLPDLHTEVLGFEVFRSCWSPFEARHVGLLIPAAVGVENVQSGSQVWVDL